MPNPSRYPQIAAALRRDIINGQYPDQEKLPGVRRLAGRYGTSPSTMWQAVFVLEWEGLLRREQGRGAFITHLAREGDPHPQPE